MPVRYMGTKRYLATHVRNAIMSVRPDGPVIDLFSGIGAVASAMAPDVHVITNDALAFTTVLARARFLGGDRTVAPSLVPTVRNLFRDREQQLRRQYRDFLARESSALEGDWQSLASFMEEFPHVGNSSDAAKAAAAAGACTTSDKYCLATLYFAGGYFSLRQAIHLDALRYAIESADLGNADRNWLLAAWISSAAVVINAPGHTAQYLKVSGEISQARVRRAWRRNVWDVFLDRLTQVSQEGTAAWRSGNKVFNDEALSLAASDKVDGVGAIYADPPYTKDHYSRYYHVYETLFRYDFPDSAGAGRYRSDRFVTEFSIKTKVSGAFEALAAAAKKRDAPLVLSYPDNGLLVGAGVELGELLRSHFNHVAVMSFGHDHSTLGASQGEQKKRAVENIYVCS